MQDFNNDNYNRNPYEKPSVNDSGKNAEITQSAEQSNDAANAADNRTDDNPYADYYVHKSSGYVPPESSYGSGESANGNANFNGDGNDYSNPYEYKNSVFKSGNALMPDKKSGKGMAIASLVLGIISLLLCCCGNFVTVVLAATGLILGIIAQAKNPGGIAVAGIITSAFGLVFGIIGVVLMFIGMAGGLPDFPFDSYPPDFSDFPDSSFDHNSDAFVNVFRFVSQW